MKFKLGLYQISIITKNNSWYKQIWNKNYGFDIANHEQEL